nr:scyllo-inositol 2-dehydrogenase (nad(+)) [Quercus suber]
MAQPTAIRVAVIGVGSIGPRHAESVVSCPDTRLLCIVDPAPSAHPIAQTLGVPRFDSLQQMLTVEHCIPDAAIVCTPSNTHVPVSQELLAVGIHILVEKPISTTAAAGQQLVDTLRQLHRIEHANHDQNVSKSPRLIVGHHRRFNPYVTATKRAIDANVIGRVIAISGLWTTYKPASYFEPPAAWRAQAASGGGPVLTNLVHEIDVLQYLLGPVTRVHAEQTPSQRAHDVEEGAAVLLRFASGVVGTFLVSDATPSAHNFESATGENPTIPQQRRDVLRVFGAEGTLSMGDMQITRYGEGEEKSWSSELAVSQLEVAEEQVPFDEQLKHFVNVIRGVETPRCSAEDGLSALRVCEAIKRAIVTCLPVDVIQHV